MCTLLLAFDPAGPTPIVVAANRDEFRSRPSVDPHDWGDGVFAGRDRRAGGTWLAVGRGRLAAVTNVRGGTLRADAPSRGLLPLAAVRDELPARFDDWNAFNLVIATPTEIRVVTHDGLGGVRDDTLAPGRHAIVNDPFGAASPRTAAAIASMEDRGPCFEALATHGEEPGALCRHGAEYGTVSATVVGLDRAGRVVRYRHRDGLPCSARELDLDAAARRAMGATAGPEPEDAFG